MNVAVGPFTIAAALLVLGGVAKASSPQDTANALRGVGLPGSGWLVRAGGALEAGVGSFAIATSSRVSAVLVALSYGAFALFVAVALARRVPIATCGCFGKADTPPSLVHIVVDVTAAAVAVAILIDPAKGIVHTVEHQPLAGVPYIVLVVTGTFLAFLSLTVLPRVLTLVRKARAT